MNAKSHQEEDEIQLDASNAAERKTLLWVLGINFLQVILAGLVGVIADSTGLLGAALDNLEMALSMQSASMPLVRRLWPKRVSHACPASF